jgi:hypothetical protein
MSGDKQPKELLFISESKLNHPSIMRQLLLAYQLKIKVFFFIPLRMFKHSLATFRKSKVRIYFNHL